MTQKTSLLPRSLIAALVLAAGAFASDAWADCASPQTFTVGTTADDGSPESLRFLVESSAQDCDTVEIPEGTYVFDGGGPGYILVDKSITIRGAGAGLTVIDANGPATAEGVFAVDTGTTGAFLTLEGVTLQNGGTGAIGVVGAGGLHVSDTSFLGNKSSSGGGIVVTSGAANQVIVDRCTFQDNEALDGGSGAGSAIFSDAAGVSLSINDSTFSGNHADICTVIMQAGALSLSNSHIVDNDATGTCGGLGAVQASAVIADSEISRNTAQTEAGGAAFVDADVVISNTEIRDNEAGANCGGIALETQNPPLFGHVTLVDSTVDGNRAAENGGGLCGGVLASNPVAYTIDRTTISNNLADSDNTNDGSGGGLVVIGSVSLTRSWVHDNVSNSQTQTGAGGLLIVGGYSIVSTLVEKNAAVNGFGGGGAFSGVGTILDSTFSENSATGNDGAQDAGGGGIVVAADGILTLTNSTVAGNRADGSGGGILTEGALVYVSNSTLAFNVADANSGGLGAGGDGGGFFNGLTTTSLINVADSIVAGNVDASAGAESPDCFNDVVAGNLLNLTSANIVQSLDGCGIVSRETEPSEVDPLFDVAGLAENEGPAVGDPDAPAVLKTVALQSSSPALDAAANAGCPAADERGAARPIDGNGDGEAVCDLGAFEAPEFGAGTTGGETTGASTGGETTGGTSGSEDSGGCSLIR
ncbi:MAG TPA: choice-of-anchor Q domain-containing protein [bacterium]|nr:choice-of-anchor Q domain-containing protein [bacterium]